MSDDIAQWQEISRLKMLIGVLRQEVKAWRKVNELHQFLGWMEVNEDHERAAVVEEAIKATDAANALEEK